jgi:hypothetical protein
LEGNLFDVSSIRCNEPYAFFHSPASFAQWYRDVEGVNKKVAGQLTLQRTAGTSVYSFDSDSFFPLTDLGWGNTPGYSVIYHFTTEIHT